MAVLFFFDSQLGEQGGEIMEAGVIILVAWIPMAHQAIMVILDVTERE